MLENITLESLEDSFKSGIPIIALLDPAILYDGIQEFGLFVVIVDPTEDVIYY